MSIEFEFPEGNESDVIGEASQLLIDAIADYQAHKFTYAGLYFDALVIWTGINNNPTLHKIVEEGLRKKRQEMATVFTLDLSKGDPIRKRYDPSFWMDEIPRKMESDPSNYVYDKCKSLLSFLEGLNSQK
jgi:hypothetical protein